VQVQVQGREEWGFALPCQALLGKGRGVFFQVLTAFGSVELR